jgi:glyoxylase-like metal-dependent hydrolase (beta-lactamase superfamily II)
MKSELNCIEVTPNIIMTAMVTKETNKLIRPYFYSNLSCINLPEELVFINAGPFLNEAQEFRKIMEERFEKETSHLILTSKTWDQIWGMKAFKDVKVISSSATKSGMRQNLKKGVDVSYREWIIRQVPEDEKLHENLKNNVFFIPTIGFSNNKVIGPKNFSLHLESTLAGAISIYCPVEKALFTGNAIQSFMPPFVWPITSAELYRKWEALDIEHIIPGRGPAVKKGYLIQIRKWMESHLNKLREYKDLDIPKKDILKQEFPDHPGKQRISWIEGGPYHTGMVQRLTGYWYKQILQEGRESEDDLMFIS